MRYFGVKDTITKYFWGKETEIAQRQNFEMMKCAFLAPIL